MGSDRLVIEIRLKFGRWANDLILFGQGLCQQKTTKSSIYLKKIKDFHFQLLSCWVYWPFCARVNWKWGTGEGRQKIVVNLVCLILCSFGSKMDVGTLSSWYLIESSNMAERKSAKTDLFLILFIIWDDSSRISQKLAKFRIALKRIRDKCSFWKQIKLMEKNIVTKGSVTQTRKIQVKEDILF